MYVKYTWLTTATEAQVRSDIIAIVAGATSTAGLSASCDTANTTWISTTISTNWAVYDVAPATTQGGYATGTSQVLRSLNLDGTSYKYAQIGLASGILSMVGWENWNNTGSNTSAGAMYPGAIVLAHGGFNVTSGASAKQASTYPFTFTYTSATSIYIFTTPRYIVIAPAPLQGVGGCSLVEYSRDTPSLDSTYPCHAIMKLDTDPTLAAAFGVCRVKNPTAVGDYGQSQPVLATNGTNLSTNALSYIDMFRLAVSSSGGTGTQSSAQTLGVGEVLYALTMPITVQGSSGSTACVILGKVQGNILFMPANIVSSNQIDEITVSGSTYVIIKGLGSSAVLVPKA